MTHRGLGELTAEKVFFFRIKIFHRALKQLGEEEGREIQNKVERFEKSKRQFTKTKTLKFNWNWLRFTKKLESTKGSNPEKNTD